MLPAILVDPDATNKLLDAILKADIQQGRRALSRLARTCKAFSEPALDKLWQDLDSFAPLIGLFPSHLLRKTRRPGLGLAKQPEEKDWKRLLAYGERVRRITYNETTTNVSPSIFNVFQNRPRNYILPNLQQLTWKVESAVGLERCSMFLNPGLEELALEVETRIPQLSAFLADMCSRTRLKAFSFTSPRAIPNDFTELLMPQILLEKIVLVAPGALAAQVGRWAASLPALHSLQLDLTGRSAAAVEGFFDSIGPRSGVTTPSSEGSTDSGVFSGDELDFSEIRKSAFRLTRALRSKGSFAQLRKVHLTGEASNLTAFLKHLTVPLTRIELVMEDPVDKADWLELSSLVSEQFGESLQSLRITATGSSRFTELVRSTSRAEPPSLPLPLHRLSPLPHLTRLDIDLPDSVVFRDVDLVHLAKVCPSLEVLRLCPAARFQANAPSLTLDGIRLLLNGCRKLQLLAVVCSAGEENESVPLSHFTSSQSLLRLHVGHSWIKDHIQTTISLSQMAPHLEILKWFNERNRVGFVEANCRGWEKVNELLPHVQKVRLVERRRAVSALAQLIHVRPPTSDKEVDATISGMDRGVLAVVRTRESGAQATPSTACQTTQSKPPLVSAAVDARPTTINTEIQASSITVEQSIDVRPVSTSTGVDASIATHSQSTHTTAMQPRHAHSYVVSHIYFILSLAFRFFLSTSTYIPFRLDYFWLALYRVRQQTASRPPSPEVNTPEAPADPAKADEGGSPTSSHSSDSDFVITPPDGIGHENIIDSAETSRHPAATQVAETAFLQRLCQTECAVPTPHVRETTRNERWLIWATSTASRFHTMSERKQERDFTPEVDALLQEVESLVKAGKLQQGLDKLFALEKATRNAFDTASTTRLVKAIAEHTYTARDYTLLNSSITLLSKKHGQIKSVVQTLVQLAMDWLEEVKKEAGIDRWLELVETLRGVTDGKIFLETPRARVTLLFSHYHESLAILPTASSPPPKQCLQTASDLLSDLQVETYSSMERREKTEFILEQMRLLIAVARLKDAEIGGEGKDALGGGEAEWTKVRVGGRKINEGFLKAKENEDLKLKYYDLMTQHALRQTAYLDVANYYHKVWETPSIKEDEAGRGREALEHIIYYVVLAPHNNEQSDMLHRMFADPALLKLELHYNLVKCFVTRELMRWPGIEAIYGPFLRTTPVFLSDKRWEDLHTRVIEHNVRVVAQYYTRITLPRLTSLLDLTPQQTEDTLARLVVSGTVWARIDRPAQIVNFRRRKGAEDVMNDWSSDMQKLLGLVEKTWMGMNAAQAAQSRAKA